MPVAVAAPHPAAVDAARTVAEAGGNALDAALAAAAALTVAYPNQCSTGGDLVAIVRPAGSPARAVLSIGAAAAAVDVTALRATGDRMPSGGPQTVTVPGVVAGWAAVAALGARLPLADLLAPARALAAGGVAVSAGLRRAVSAGLDRIRADPGLRALLLDGDGDPVDTLVQPALAATFDELAADWRSFYTGSLGRRLADGLNAFGSPLAAADLAAHRAEVTDPLEAVIGGVTWRVAPPPVQGATFLAVAGSPRLLADAYRARQARDTLLGDPLTGPIDVDGLLLRRPLPHSATTEGTGAKPGGDTVAVTAADDAGNAITLIQSVFASFGSGLLDPGTGIVLHNRGSSFSLDPAHPGRLRPGARPPHTLCPAIATAGDTVLAVGCQGGRSQPWILAQVADAVHAPDLSAVVARPRWVIGAAEIDRPVPTLLLEPGTPDAERLSTIADGLGLTTEITAGPHDDAGHVQVARLSGATLTAAADPRADGAGIVVA
ncbi:gamma-glutamyltranspeptidase [Actinoplanes sp. OR16]|uniref:gamma-glutamyltransferase n=1 Tax=Actinoplanes sp. OR16 TaxID=946334 RepID=UPI000F6D51CE|nr:gamma-glutamyltransferase [Actinoplanes sp. OR16]BBH68564.1 gamma-glutamyltranspeptidase [Actinoplanes sp. OR16]